MCSKMIGAAEPMERTSIFLQELIYQWIPGRDSGLHISGDEQNEYFRSFHVGRPKRQGISRAWAHIRSELYQAAFRNEN